MAHVAVTAVGADRPGIVAAVTKVLMEQGCNLEDTSMTILRGHFAMMLVVAAPASVTAEALEAALAEGAQAFNLVLEVRDIDEAVAASPAGDDWTVSVYGADRPGIVHGVTALLAGAGVNVVDLTTRMVGRTDQPAYAMVLEVTVPDGVDVGALGRQLTALAGELGVDCSLHSSDADIL